MNNSLFDEMFATVTEKASKAAPTGSLIKVDLGGKYLFLDGTGSSNQISTENRDADCTIKASEEDFHAILHGKLNPMAAIFQQKAKLEGNMTLALGLVSLFG